MEKELILLDTSILIDYFRKTDKKNQMIAIPDLLIGATAKVNGLKLATMNTSHFKRITSLQVVNK